MENNAVSDDEKKADKKRDITSKNNWIDMNLTIPIYFKRDRTANTALSVTVILAPGSS
jgi:hypothetical protein